MKDIKDWDQSAISLMGDPSKKRSTVTKAVLIGLVGLMAAKAVVAPLSGYEDSDLQARGGIEHTQIKEHMGSVSKQLTAEYGSDHTVIVLNNDPGLKFILANMQPKLAKDDYGFATSTGQYRNKAVSFAEEHLGLKVNSDMVRKNNLYDTLMDQSDGPKTVLLGERSADQPYDSLVVINGWGGDVNMEYKNKFPFQYDVKSQNAFAFFHELTHGVDVRDGRPDGDVKRSDMVLHTEAVADMGTALLFYQKTGNFDEWNYNIRPMRLALSQDVSHATATIVDKALANVDLIAVKDMSDREVMIYAKEQVNTTVKDMLLSDQPSPQGFKYSQWFEMNRLTSVYAGPEEVGNAYHAQSMRFLDRFSGGHGMETVQEHGRTVMEASLNNLEYNNAFGKHEDAFKAKVVQHMADYKDQKVADAYSIASAGGKFDERVFATEMGFKIDYQASMRREHNEQVIHAYFSEKTGQSADVGFEMHSFEQNMKQSVVGRYAEKAVDYVMSKANMDLKW